MPHQRAGAGPGGDCGMRGLRPDAIPPGHVRRGRLRIAQEPLVNAAKHAAGQRVAVRLDYGEADARLTVSKDGRSKRISGIARGV
jgi:nitrate/nitrite-specific signal transduction histidine kinase